MIGRSPFRHHVQGSELWALFYAYYNEYASNMEGWLEKYMDHEWPVDRRGNLPPRFPGMDAGTI